MSLLVLPLPRQACLCRCWWVSLTSNYHKSKSKSWCDDQNKGKGQKGMRRRNAARQLVENLWYSNETKTTWSKGASRSSPPLWSAHLQSAANANWHLRLAKRKEEGETERERKTAWNVCCETIVIDKCSFFILPTNYDYLLTPCFFFFFISFLLPLKLVYDIFAIILEIPLRESTLDNKLLHAQTSSLLRLILWILILIPLPLHNYVKHAKVIHKSFANHPESWGGVEDIGIRISIKGIFT